jgi:N6-adenosine-specific RNA methylase IME4
VLLDQQVARTFPTGPYAVTNRFDDLTKRHYGLIAADPAWRFKTYDNATAVTARGREEHYKTQTLEEIAAVPVGSIAADDCVLILWFLQPLLPPALEIVKHWGFTFKTLGPVWGKTTKARSLHRDLARRLRVPAGREPPAGARLYVCH